MGNFFYAFMRLFVQIYFNIKYRIKIYNKVKLPKNYTKSYIIACNHQKYTDPPAIAAVVKGRFSFMAKDELFHQNPFFTFIIKMCGAFPVVRGAGDGAVIDKSVDFLKKGRVLVIFPEGTRSKDGKIGRAKSGVALIAATAGVDVLPICIMYGLGGKKKNLDFAVGDMIPTEEIAVSDMEEGGKAESRKELRRVSERILGSIKALQTQIYTERGEMVINDE